jgi:DNA repair protein SbcC/Rad50
LSERSLRETEACIQSTLRLDYETFVNASFFLQGKADQFTQQRPGDRKRILSSILGLEIWETYKQRTAEKRKNVEAELSSLDGRLSEINIELAEEQNRKERLKHSEAELERLSQLRQTQEKALENIRRVAATLQEQRKMVDNLSRQLQTAQTRVDTLQVKLAERSEERSIHAALLKRSAEIEAAYQNWQNARAVLEQWEKSAGQFREQEKRRQVPLDEINTARARIEEQISILNKKSEEIDKLVEEANLTEKQLQEAREALQTAEAELLKKTQLETDLDEARQRQADARAENPRLKQEMEDLKDRIDRLNQSEGADCPLCGQQLSVEERHNLIENLTTQGREMGDRYRNNQALLKEFDQLVNRLEVDIRILSKAETALRSYQRIVDQLSDRLESCRQQAAEWEVDGRARLEHARRELAEETFAPRARKDLSQIDAELKATGYDATAHDLARRAEAEGRTSEIEILALEKARATLAPLEREIAEMETQCSLQVLELEQQQSSYSQAAAAYAAAEAQAPDLYAAERDLLSLQEQENALHREVGAAKQKVLVLEDLKKRKKNLQAQREEQARQIGYFKQLERAFGKDGVPALLIEQALPQIEARSNELLERLSGGSMSIRFATQAAYKDKRREDLKETLDILISDGAGTRDYEMFSGGEAFRVNFAIRLALSEVLAQRAGARLQTLVIDEGFGSQDAQGRQRLVEAINMVQNDFSKILVITHIDELKDHFPARIEIEKNARGSSVRVY